MNDVMSIISSRRSHRAYKPDAVTPEQLQTLIDAFLASPSAVNKQPWHLSVVTNQQLLDEMHAEMIANMMKAAPESRSPRLADSAFHVFYHAPLVLFLSADPAWRYSALDCGIAIQNIALAAESLGLGSVILGMPRDCFTGEKKAEFEQRLGFLPGQEFMIAISIGIPADDKEAHPIADGHITYVD